MRHPDDQAIGGYFGREPAAAAPASAIPGGVLEFQSARSAMAAVFGAETARRAWVPHFICNVVLDALAWAGLTPCRYGLAPDRGPPDDLPLVDGDWLVCVDYFGMSAAGCDRAIRRYGAQRVLVDASQAAFHVARPGVTTVYSPRKFAGLADGGLLVTPCAVLPAAPADDAANRQRQRHLDSRANGNVARGYAEFLADEDSLHDCAPRAMAAATGQAWRQLDWPSIARRRRANHATLATALAHAGFLPLSLPADAAPLCCPLPVEGAARVRQGLAGQSIFAPLYWPDADPPEGDPVGRALRHGTVYLPCDQRYEEADMLKVAAAVTALGREP